MCRAEAPTKRAVRAFKDSTLGRITDQLTLSEQQLISDIQAVLTPDLLSKPYLKRWTPRRHRVWGHCYAASEALFHMLGGNRAGYFPVQSFIGDDSHWWIRTGKLDIDPTDDQFDDYSMVHEIRTLSQPHGGFLTKLPSKRAAEIIRRVKIIRATLNRYRTVR